MVKIKKLDEILVDGAPAKEYEDKHFDLFNVYEEKADADLFETFYRDDSAAIYADPNGEESLEDGRRPRRIATSKYIEAKKGQRYEIRYRWGPNFPFKEHVCYVLVLVDGQYAESLNPWASSLQKPNGYERRSKCARHNENGNMMNDPWSFGDLNISDEQGGDGEAEKWMGTIRVLMWRATLKGMGRVIKQTNRLISAKDRPMREGKMKKGFAPTLGTNYGNAYSSNRQSRWCRKEFIDGGPERTSSQPPESSLGHPFADFWFKYRTRATLEAIQLMQRAPSPARSAKQRADDKRKAKQIFAKRLQARQAIELSGARTSIGVERHDDPDVRFVRKVVNVDKPGNTSILPIDVEEIPDRLGGSHEAAIILDDDTDDNVVISSIESVINEIDLIHRDHDNMSTEEQRTGDGNRHQVDSAYGSQIVPPTNGQHQARYESPLFHPLNTSEEVDLDDPEDVGQRTALPATDLKPEIDIKSAVDHARQRQINRYGIAPRKSPKAKYTGKGLKHEQR